MISKSYSKKGIHFSHIDTLPLFKEIFQYNRYTDNSFSIVDMGCGDGTILRSLIERGLLTNCEKIVGVDISEIRCNRLKKNVKNADAICSDVCHLPQLKNASFDIGICTQVIEHVSDDTLLLNEINRILKNDGLLYISSVIKKWYGFYIYTNNGKIRIDPTHIREYSSKEEFTSLLQVNGFNIIKTKITPVKYSLLDLLIRMMIKLSFINPDGNVAHIYKKNKKIHRLGNIISIPIIGYYTIEVLCKK